MTEREVIGLLSQHLSELEQTFGVQSLSLFGSFARDEASETSDVDLLVDFGKAPTFRQYTGALLYLEDLLGCKVDLVTQGTVKPELILIYRARLAPYKSCRVKKKRVACCLWQVVKPYKPLASFAFQPATPNLQPAL